MKKILFICDYLPQKIDSGIGSRAHYFLKHLGEKNDVTVIAFSQNSSNNHSFNLRTLQLVPESGFVGRLRYFGAFFSKNEPSIVARFNSPRFTRSVTEALKNEKFDIVFCRSLPLANIFLKNKFSTKLIVDICDIDSNRYEQYFEYVNPVVKKILTVEVKKLRKFENDILSSCDIATVSSKNELSLIEKKFLKKIVVVQNGVDTQYFKSCKKDKNPKNIIFTGMMKYFPNVDSVCWFTEKILPVIRRSLPEVKFFIIGRQPSKTVKRLSSKNVIVTGEVEDVRPFYKNAAVFVAPLRIARGIQIKVLESLSMNTACVITEKVAQGLGLKEEKAFLRIASDEKELAQKTILLLQKNKWGNLPRNFVDKNFSWEKSLKILDNVVK